jgi:hypothetical protein
MQKYGLLADELLDLLDQLETSGLTISVELFGTEVPIKLGIKPSEGEET